MSTQHAVSVPPADPRDFSRDYPGIAAGIEAQIKALTTGQRAPSLRRNLGPEAMRLMKNAEDLSNQMQAQGWQFASVVNLNPFPIKVNGVLHNETLPACEIDKPFARLVIRDWEIDARDNGNGVFTTHAFVPLQLAEDYKREALLNDWGGIFFYGGDYDPDDANMPSHMKTRVAELYAAAQQSCLRWCRRRFREAEVEFNRPNGDKRIIGDLHRLAGSWMLAHGFLKEKDRPKWMDMTTAEAQLEAQCPSCRKRVDAGVIQCSGCSFIFDPKQAYLLGIITADHASLGRLPKKDLKELGLENVKSIAHLIPEAQQVVSTDATSATPLTDESELSGDEDESELDGGIGTDDVPDLESAVKHATAGFEAQARKDPAEAKAAAKAKGKPKPTTEDKSDEQKKAEESI